MEEKERLIAKVKVANDYLRDVMKYRGKIYSTDIYRVVTRAMRPFVEIVSMETAERDGTGMVRLRGAV